MSKIRLIRGYHQFNLNTPEEVGEGWLIFNAPRPFPCNKSWRGDFIHGVFYGGIDLNDEFADIYIQRANDLDASQIVFVTKDDVLMYGKQFCKEHNLDMERFTFEQIAQSYIQAKRREDESDLP